MRDERKPDSYSGIPWVYVDPVEARAHPKGQLTLALYGIIAYLLVTGALKLIVFLMAGYPMGVVILGAVLPVLAGLGLWLRAPWAVVVTILMAGFSLYAFARNLRANPDLMLLVDALVAVGIIFYLLEADRPNLIYRHRYRKYSALREGEHDDQS